MAMSSNTKNQMSMSGNLKNGNVLAMSGNGKTLLGTYVAQLGLPRVTANVTSWKSRRWQHVFFVFCHTCHHRPFRNLLMLSIDLSSFIELNFKSFFIYFTDPFSLSSFVKAFSLTRPSIDS